MKTHTKTTLSLLAPLAGLAGLAGLALLGGCDSSPTTVDAGDPGSDAAIDAAIDAGGDMTDGGGTPTDASVDGGGTPLEGCDALAALFVNAPLAVTESDCMLTDGSTTTCCTFSFASDLVEDGPYCPPSLTSPPPYGLSIYDGATNPGPEDPTHLLSKSCAIPKDVRYTYK